MKIDLYTKGILTVIALSLVVIAFSNTPIIKEALAEYGHVEICEGNFLNCAGVTTGSLQVYCVNCK
jgi:hypothetical protein